MEHEKMKKIAKVLAVVTKVLYLITFICSWFLFAFGIVGAVLASQGSKFIESTVEELELGKYTVTVADNFLDPSSIYVSVFAIILLGAFGIVASKLAYKYLKPVLDTMSEGRPFEAGNALAIKKLAILELVIGTLYQVSEVVQTLWFFNKIDINQLFNSEFVTGGQLTVGFDITYLLVAAVLFLLYYVFKYGEALQIESDETL